jgi:Ni,Fe-hydrogenase III small subunit
LCTDDRIELDTGKCLFCRACEKICPNNSIRFTPDFRLSAAQRNHLIINTASGTIQPAFNARAKDLYGRSFSLRVVSSGGCNACEADTNVLNTIAWDLGRFGIHFSASPRHADGLIVIGPSPGNMHSALSKTYEAVAFPKFVIAIGACAISGGLYAGLPEACDGTDPIIPVDLHIPGCPPHPITILEGMLRFLGRIPENQL